MRISMCVCTCASHPLRSTSLPFNSLNVCIMVNYCILMPNCCRCIIQTSIILFKWVCINSQRDNNNNSNKIFRFVHLHHPPSSVRVHACLLLQWRYCNSIAALLWIKIITITTTNAIDITFTAFMLTVLLDSFTFTFSLYADSSDCWIFPTSKMLTFCLL